MKVYALADLHLSLDRPFDLNASETFSGTKPMDIFGTRWDAHIRRIHENWCDVVTADDIVLVAGDISWAMTLAEACWDLDFIGNLPGRKIMIRGNHDYWWHSVKKIREQLAPGVEIIQNDAVIFGDIAICGTRLWSLPGSADFGEEDVPIYRRELIRQELSLKAAGGRSVINMNHYMPVNPKGDENELTELFSRYHVCVEVYGHLHDKSHAIAVEGEKYGVTYVLTSADYLDFTPRFICEI